MADPREELMARLAWYGMRHRALEGTTLLIEPGPVMGLNQFMRFLTDFLAEQELGLSDISVVTYATKNLVIVTF